jgi:IS4 transposase
MAYSKPTPQTRTLPKFPARFQPQHLNGRQKLTRTRKFTPRTFFLTLLQLVGGTASQGYLQALAKAFPDLSKMPSAGALTQIRARVSWRFFSDHLERLVLKHRPKMQCLKKLRIFAIDGLQLEIPRTKSILKAGYTGRAVSAHRDTYYPRLYLTHCYDVISRMTEALTHHTGLDEISDAKALIKNLGSNSLVLYDRLYFCKTLLQAHKRYKSYFLMRCKRTACREVKAFFGSPKRRSKIRYAGVEMWLVKVTHPQRPGEVAVFATNLPKTWLSAQTIRELYSLRWEVENSFRNLVQTLGVEQWHSKTINGVLQELYAAFFLLNLTQLEIGDRVKKPKNPLDPEYERPNFKLIFEWIVRKLADIFQGIRGCLGELAILIKLSTRKRKRLKRKYPRELKYSAPIYPYNNTRWTWEALN